MKLQQAFYPDFRFNQRATYFDAGNETFPAVFSNVKDKTKAISELNKLALSELGYIYLESDGTLRIENNSARKGTRELDKVPLHPDRLDVLGLLDGDTFSLLDGNSLLLNETEEAQLTFSAEKQDMELADDVINAAFVRAYPTRTATSLEVVFNLGSPIPIAGKTSITFIGHYTNPNGGNPINATNIQTPVITTDYLANTLESGGGTNISSDLVVSVTAYGDLAEFTITNNNIASGYITKLQLRGYGIYYDTSIKSYYENTDSVEAYGDKVLEIDQKYKKNFLSGLAYGKSVIEEFKNPKSRIKRAKFLANKNHAHLMACSYLDVGSLVKIYEPRSELYKWYYITGRSFVITLGKIISVVFSLIEATSILSGSLIPIPLDFGNSAWTEIDYGYCPRAAGLIRRSISAKIYPRTVAGRILYNITDNSGEGFSFAFGGTNQLQFYQKDAPDLGAWNTDVNSISANNWHTLIVTRDRSTSPLARPIIYIDGVVANITEVSTPTVGNISSDDGLHLKVGSISFNGVIEDVRMYDRIITPDEVTEITANDAYAQVVTDGMVFQSHCLNSDLGNTEDFTGDLPDDTNVIDNIFKYVGSPNIAGLSERSWTLRTTPNAQLAAVMYSPTLHMFAACGDTGTKTIMVSSNGYDWSYVSGTATEHFYAICWSEELGMFVAVGDNVIRTSTDGNTWISRTTPGIGDWRDVCWSPELNLFVATSITGTAGHEFMTSSNGINWMFRNAPVSGGKYKAVAWSPELGIFAAVRREGSGNRVAISSNGTTWSIQQAPAPTFDTTDFWDIAWSPELGMFIATAGNLFIGSTDGVTWTSRTAPSLKTWTGITWSSELGIFLAVASDGTSNRSMYSTDGMAWNHFNTPADYGWYGICYSSELQRFVAVQISSSNTTRVMTF